MTSLKSCQEAAEAAAEAGFEFQGLSTGFFLQLLTEDHLLGGTGGVSQHAIIGPGIQFVSELTLNLCLDHIWSLWPVYHSFSFSDQQ